MVGLIAAGGIAAGCGDDDKSDGGGNGDSGAKKVNVAFLTWTYTDYAQAEEKGMKRALGGNGSVKVFNANFDPQAQQKQCEDAISSGRYNAIVITTVTQPTGVPCVKAAHAAGIPVGTLEQTIGNDPKRYYDLQPQLDGVVAVNTFPIDTQIATQAELVKGACGDANPCKALYETASADDPFSKDIIARLEKAVPALEVVQTFTANFDPAEVVKVMPDLLAANSDVNVYIAAADSSAVAALGPIEEAGKTAQIKLIGNGGSATGAKAIKEGKIFGSNGNWPITSAEQVTKAVIQAVNGEKVTNCCVDGLKIKSPQALTKETVDQYTPEW
ncbi:MAG TPA: sugar ABC transporter substrate-binding protein [Baekduia sp.]|nr:sugar ABC transporter substrate-binding protein [Baekduia sp.]